MAQANRRGRVLFALCIFSNLLASRNVRPLLFVIVILHNASLGARWLGCFDRGQLVCVLVHREGLYILTVPRPSSLGRFKIGKGSSCMFPTLKHRSSGLL